MKQTIPRGKHVSIHIPEETPGPAQLSYLAGHFWFVFLQSVVMASKAASSETNQHSALNMFSLVFVSSLYKGKNNIPQFQIHQAPKPKASPFCFRWHQDSQGSSTERLLTAETRQRCHRRRLVAPMPRPYD